MKKRISLFIPFLLVLSLFAQPAFADDVPLWEVGIGMAGWYLPDYRGSNESRFYALPFPYLIYRGRIFRAKGAALSGQIIDSDRLRLDLSLSGSLPVHSDDNKAREGMPDLDFTGEIGPSLEWKIFENRSRSLWVKAPLRVVFTVPDATYIGVKFAPYIDYNWSSSILPQWRMSLTAGPIFATERYHDYFYEVEPQFARPGRPEYHPPGGYSGISAGFGIARDIGNFRLSPSIRYDNLAGASFEDSPLVKTDSYFSAGITLTWFFAKSKTMVPRPQDDTTPVLRPERTD